MVELGGFTLLLGNLLLFGMIWGEIKTTMKVKIIKVYNNYYLIVVYTDEIYEFLLVWSNLFFNNFLFRMVKNVLNLMNLLYCLGPKYELCFWPLGSISGQKFLNIRVL